MALIDTILDPMVARLEVHTTVAPAIVVDDPFKVKAAGAAGAGGGAAGGGGGFDLARFLKPKIMIYDRQGGDPVEFMPYGDPGESLWPVVVAGLGLLIGVLSYGTWRGLKRR
jgi:hypothetical protein